MLFIALDEKRINTPVLLEVKLEAVSRPGVLFSDCNATKNGSVQSASPSIVHFDVVKEKSHFAVDPLLRHFYQAEVLVPSPIPPHLIVFPDKPMRLKRRNWKPTDAKTKAKVKMESTVLPSVCVPCATIVRTEICAPVGSSARAVEKPCASSPANVVCAPALYC
jgi:ssDNA thymidine ADP-ribosyltransferase, DarT